jgi:hypothetical protein
MEKQNTRSSDDTLSGLEGETDFASFPSNSFELTTQRWGRCPNDWFDRSTHLLWSNLNDQSKAEFNSLFAQVEEIALEPSELLKWLPALQLRNISFANDGIVASSPWYAGEKPDLVFTRKTISHPPNEDFTPIRFVQVVTRMSWLDAGRWLADALGLDAK